MPFGLGIWEILILAGVLVLLFGAKGAPGMAKRLGSGVKELKDAVGELDPRGLLDGKDEPAKAPPRQLEATKAVAVAALAPEGQAPEAQAPAAETAAPPAEDEQPTG